LRGFDPRPSLGPLVAGVAKTSRWLLALLLWAGLATILARPTEPPSVDGWLADHIGQDNYSCGDDDGRTFVFCGADLVVPVFVDRSLFAMPRDTCSRLLDELFAQQACDFGDESCGQFERANPTGPSTIVAGSWLGFALPDRGIVLPRGVLDERTLRPVFPDERLDAPILEQPVPPPRSLDA